MKPEIPHIDNWKVGQTGRGVAKVGYESRRTEPPKPYTEATLLADMKSAAKFLKDPAMREALKEAEGLGTPATRAPTIEKLKSMGYIKQEKSYIRSTPEGRAVINGLPSMLVDPGTTALWEELLSKISRGQVPMDKFMKMIVSDVGKLVDTAKGAGINVPGKAGAGASASPEAPLEQPCPQCAGKLLMSERWVKCEKGDFTLFREVATLKLKDEQLVRLLKYGRVGPLEGFYSQAKKKKFSANLVLDKDGKTKFDFSK